MQTFNEHFVENEFFGIYDSVPGDEIPKGYFYKLDNAFCSDGKIARVPGSTVINTAIATQLCNGLTSFEQVASSNKWLIACINGASNAQLYKSTGTNFSAIGSANLTNAKQMWFEVANDILYGFNGSEVVSYDGTTVTKNPATVPLGKFAHWFHNYLFVAGTTSNPNRIFWSNIGDPTTFSGTALLDVNPGDSDSIQGICAFPGQDELLIFKRDTIWSITGYSGSTFTATTAAAQNTNSRILGYGTVSPFSIVPVGNDVYFFSQLGNSPVIRSLTKTINAVTIGGGVISDTIRTTMGNINKTNFQNITSSFDGRYVYWAVPTGASTTNNQIIALDTWEINKSKGIYPFSTMTGKNASFMTVSTIPGYPLTYFSDATATGLVYKFDTALYTDNLVTNTMDVQTRDYSFDGSHKTKWKYGYVTHDTGSAAQLQIGARIDRGVSFTTQKTSTLQGVGTPLGSFILGTSLLGGQGTGIIPVTFAQVIGHYFGLQFKDITANNVVIHKWEIWGHSKGLRRS